MNPRNPNNPVVIAMLALPCLAAAQSGGPYDLTWNTLDGGGGRSTGGIYEISGTIGQPEAGAVSSAGYNCFGGFWAGGGASACYANCDGSTTAPVLNVLDFACFLNKFAASDTDANCDGSTTAPVLNVLDFACFLNRFAAGCS